MGFLDSISSALGFVKNIPIVGDLVGGIGKTVTGAAGDWLGNALGLSNADKAYDQSRESTAYAFDRSMDAYKSRYQATVADMRAAGLNPILAATGGFSVGNAPQMSSAQAFQAPSPYGYTAQSVRNLTEVGKIEEETKKVIQERFKTIEEVQKVIADKDLAIQKKLESIEDANKARKEAGKASAQEFEATSAAFEAKARMVRMRSEIERNYSEAEALVSRGNLNEAERNQVAERIKNIKVERDQMNLEVKKLTLALEQLQRISDVYKGDAGGIITYAREILDALKHLPK